MTRIVSMSATGRVIFMPCRPQRAKKSDAKIDTVRISRSPLLRQRRGKQLGRNRRYVRPVLSNASSPSSGAAMAGAREPADLTNFPKKIVASQSKSTGF